MKSDTTTSTSGETIDLPLPAYIAVALLSGAVLAYELFVMRVFANSGWSHFGSTVISIAMFGFGVFSTALCIWKKFFGERAELCAEIALALLGPAMIVANSVAQMVPFNPIFLVSDPGQKYYLAGYFLLYFIPFLLGAMFLGLFFLVAQRDFGKAYFANMTGSGLGGLALFGGMYLFAPERLYIVPVVLWIAGAMLWSWARDREKVIPVLAVSALVTLGLGAWWPQVVVSPYKGVSYAKKFPDSREIYHSASPFGFIEVYSSSYFHFAPGLSDTATLYLKDMPEKAYLGMYIDGDGPIGIMKDLPDSQAEYIRFLPMSMPYILKERPDVLVLQFGGGIPTNAAIELGANRITVAEGNPMVVRTVRDSEYISGFTGRILENGKVRLIPSDGRIYVRQGGEDYDIVDLSLADSTGLSMPGGSSIHEKYAYTRETLLSCIRALRKDGIFSVTIWNKEDPPKSALKFLSTAVQAAIDANRGDVSGNFFIAHTYLSTFSVLYKNDGFREDEVRKLLDYCRKMSFDVLYAPGREAKSDPGAMRKVFQSYRDTYFGPEREDAEGGDDVDVSAGALYRLAAERFISGDFRTVEDGYVFNTEPLTNDRPYFAGFVKFGDIPKFLDKLEAVSDEWGYLLLWATLLLSIVFGLVLMLLPLIFGWRALFARDRGKVSIVMYFMCLGIGYILLEIGLISKYILCLGNATVSVTVLITGMLVFSGIGSYVSGRFMERAGRAMVFICISLAAILLLYTLSLDRMMNVIGMWPYPVRVFACLALLFPPAFLMGFPFALGMATLSNQKKEHFFVWAWGINGSFSVVGSVLVPIIAVNFGLSSIIVISACIYLAALPCFLRFRSVGAAGGTGVV